MKMSDTKEEEKKQNVDVTPDGSGEQTAADDSQMQDSETKADEMPKSELDEAKDKIAALQLQVETLTKQNDELKDQFLRKTADFDNYRKRMLKEKQDDLVYANTNLLKDLLDSLDNFDRTVEAAAVATDPKAIADGVKVINSSLVNMLETKYNLAAYGQAGDAFDPDIHEAIGKSEDPVAEPVLKAVYLKGYKLKDRVIRHAKVMVSMPDGTVKPDEEKAETEESKASEAESK